MHRCCKVVRLTLVSHIKSRATALQSNIEMDTEDVIGNRGLYLLETSR